MNYDDWKTCDSEWENYCSALDQCSDELMLMSDEELLYQVEEICRAVTDEKDREELEAIWIDHEMYQRGF